MTTAGRRIDAQRTIARILESARILLAENPRAGRSEIAEHAVVHRATLNRYFPTREALIEGVLANLVVALEQRVADTHPETGDVRDALRRATLAWLDESRNWRAARYVPLGSIPLSGDAPDRLRTRMIDLFERGQSDGTIRRDIPPLIFHFTWIGLLTSWVAFFSDLEPSQLADYILELLIPGATNDR
jgi:TetR/AcrR family transcriptional regulator, mexCD-oprJ operon repressor